MLEHVIEEMCDGLAGKKSVENETELNCHVRYEQVTQSKCKVKPIKLNK